MHRLQRHIVSVVVEVGIWEDLFTSFPNDLFILNLNEEIDLKKEPFSLQWLLAINSLSWVCLYTAICLSVYLSVIMYVCLAGVDLYIM